MIVDTEYDANHRRWQMPDQREELVEYLDDLDGDQDPRGRISDQVTEAIDHLMYHGTPDVSRFMSFPTDSEDDVEVTIKSED